MERAALQLLGLQLPLDYINYFSTCQLGRFIELEEADEVWYRQLRGPILDPDIREGYETRPSISLLTPEHFKVVAPCRKRDRAVSMLILLMRVIQYFIGPPGAAGWAWRCANSLVCPP